MARVAKRKPGSAGLAPGEEPVQHQHVQVEIEDQAAAEPLREHDGSVLRPGIARCTAQLGDNGIDEDLARRGRGICSKGAQLPYFERKREHPLSHRDRREHPVRHVRGRVAHAASIAARTDAASFAREGHEQIMATVIAMPPQEPVGKYTAIEVGAKGALDIPWQATLVGGGRMLQKASSCSCTRR